MFLRITQATVAVCGMQGPTLPTHCLPDLKILGSSKGEEKGSPQDPKTYLLQRQRAGNKKQRQEVEDKEERYWEPEMGGREGWELGGGVLWLEMGQWNASEQRGDRGGPQANVSL